MCQQVNRILCGRIAEDRFISFFYCVVDWELGLLTFANAGHYAPILVRADGRVERLAAGGPVLGVFPDAVYRQHRIPIGPGDRLVLFTDGISEAQDAGDQEFGEDRLVDLAREHRACSAPALQARISETVVDLRGRPLPGRRHVDRAWRPTERIEPPQGRTTSRSGTKYTGEVRSVCCAVWRCVEQFPRADSCLDDRAQQAG